MRIRTRIALFGAAVVALTVLIFSILVYALVARGQQSEQDKQLRRRGQQAVLSLQNAAPDAFRPRRVPAAVDLADSLDIFVEVLGKDGTPLSSTGEVSGSPPPIPAPVLDAAGADSRMTAVVEPAPGTLLRVQVQPWRRPDLGLSGYLVVGQATRSVGQQLRGLRAFLIISGVLSLLIASGAIWLVLGRALRPLKAMTSAADEIGRTRDLGRRLPPVPARDEVGRMTASFNGMLQRLQEAQVRLAEALESQRRFVADASHELRTPLTTIRTNAGLLLQRPDIEPEDCRAALQDIAGESERMSRLVQDLLTLARADAGQRLDRAPLDLAPLARDICRQARTLHPNRGFTIDHDAAVPVIANTDALKQLLWILVDNAVKHTCDGGQIGLWVGARAGLALLHVTDDGTGIPGGELERIFDRLYQADASRSRGGAGLGLAIARWIVQDHGGSIFAYNNSGRGATFRVELPLAEGARPSPPGLVEDVATPRPPPSPAGGRGGDVQWHIHDERPSSHALLTRHTSVPHMDRASSVHGSDGRGRSPEVTTMKTGPGDSAQPDTGTVDIAFVLLLLQATFALVMVLGVLVFALTTGLLAALIGAGLLALIKLILLVVLAAHVARLRPWARQLTVIVEGVSLAGALMNLLLGLLPFLDAGIGLVAVLTNFVIPVAVIVLLGTPSARHAMRAVGPPARPASQSRSPVLAAAATLPRSTLRA